MSKVLGVFILSSFLSGASFAEASLTIHGVEIGIGKFHRHDHKVHPYADNNIWKNYILSDEANSQTPVIQENQDHSVTVFFSHLEELLSTVIKISKEKKMKVKVFNIEAHGMPGAMWFPEDEEMMASAKCKDWRNSAEGPDEENYDQYYSPVSKWEIIELRAISYLSSVGAPCTSGAKQWKNVTKKLRDLKSIFTADAQLHFFSCVLGLGRAGAKFIISVAPLLFTGEKAKLEASVNFGLGDWSMPEGMGFWDYQSDEQLDRDNARYPKNREDREMMQKGSIRLAERVDGKWETGLLANLDFMYGHFDSYTLKDAGSALVEDENISRLEIIKNLRFPMSVRIPGTAVRVQVE